MDISHLFQYSLFSKLFTDSSCPHYIFVIYGIWIGFQNIPRSIYGRIEEYIIEHLFDKDECSLECVLNTLDGVHELYDAVIVFTTNDIGSLDPAFLRPGRIDQIIRMDRIGPPIIHLFASKMRKVTGPIHSFLPPPGAY